MNRILKPLVFLLILLTFQTKAKNLPSDSVKLDSTEKSRENLYIITETQLRSINRQSIEFDSLKLRFQELRTNTRTSLTTIKTITKQISIISNEETATAGIIIKNDAKIKRGLNLKYVWVTIRTPLIGAGLFYLGYKAGVNNWITLKF